METAGSEAHVFTLAVRVKGDFKVAPAAGVDTVMFDVGAADRTVMLNSTWSFTFCPQHFTCNVCVPGVADTKAEKDVGSMMAVPLSIE